MEAAYETHEILHTDAICIYKTYDRVWRIGVMYITFVKGSMLLNWFCDFVTDEGLANGNTLIIGTSIVQDMPKDYSICKIMQSSALWSGVFIITVCIFTSLLSATYRLSVLYPRNEVSDEKK